MALEKELEIYNKQLPSFLSQHKGKFVLIIGEAVIDFYGAYEDAIKEGYKQAKSEPFLVKKIQETEQVHSFTRPLTPNALHTPTS